MHAYKCLCMCVYAIQSDNDGSEWPMLLELDEWAETAVETLPDQLLELEGKEKEGATDEQVGDHVCERLFFILLV